MYQPSSSSMMSGLTLPWALYVLGMRQVPQLIGAGPGLAGGEDLAVLLVLAGGLD